MKKIIFLVLMLSVSSAYADSFSCAKTFKTVNTGDSMETVRAACGDPASETKSTEQVNNTVEAIRWFYTVRPNSQSAPMFLFSVSFVNDKVVEIDKNSMLSGLLNTFSCLANDTLKTGLSRVDVMGMCGAPTSITNSQTTVPSTKSVVTWMYDLGQFHQKVYFDFEDAKLARIRRQ